MATNKIQTNCYTDGCGIRDLSFNFKTGISLDSEGHYKIAVGGNDFGGNANLYRTLYGVATYSTDAFDVSVGYARKSAGLIGAATPLDGFFASADYRSLSWVQIHIEYDSTKAWAGARVFAPNAWLPTGWSASVGADIRVYRDDKSSRSWIDVGLSIPLYKVPGTRQTSNPNPTKSEYTSFFAPGSSISSVEPVSVGVRKFSSDGLTQSTTSIEQLVLSTSQASEFVDVQKNPILSNNAPADELHKLLQVMREKGFEDIRVGRMPGGGIAVQINNATYYVNSTDGLGVALGAIPRKSGPYWASYQLILTQQNVAIVGVSGQADCLVEWIAVKPTRCIAGTLHAPGLSSMTERVKGATWEFDESSQSWKTVRFIFPPIIWSKIATEYGVLDYSAGICSTIQQAFWAGAYLEWGNVFPLIDFDDFKENRVYDSRRLTNTTDKLLAHQVFRVPSPTKTDFEVAAGQYFYNARGAQFIITQWFDDVAVNLYVRHTKYDYENVSRTFAGVEHIIPLTLRRDMNPAYHAQRTGVSRWAYGLEIKVGGTNFISSAQGVFPGVALLDRTFNSDRASMAYFEYNMSRIRSAAEK